MDKNLTKLAADAIKELKSENESLKGEVERLKIASAMAFELFNKGSVSAESLEDSGFPGPVSADQRGDGFCQFNGDAIRSETMEILYGNCIELHWLAPPLQSLRALF